MATFDFVASDEFRSCLENDAEELVRCMKASAWKSAHIMAASLIQSTLVEYLSTSGAASEATLADLPVGQLLEMCRNQQVLTPRTVELASFLRPPSDFLNPSSRIRIEAVTDETGARIAQALLEIVVNEIANHKRDTFQHRAEQIVAKIQTDSSATAIMGHLLRKISRGELERLLIEFLPKAYFDTAKSEDPDKTGILERIEQCFRLAFDFAPKDLKRTATRRFLGVLENESEYTVQSYESHFFRGSDLQLLEDEEREVVKAHFLASMGRQLTLPLVNAAAGISAFLVTEQEIRSFFVPLVLSLPETGDENLVAAIIRRVNEEYVRLPNQLRKGVSSWIGRLRWSMAREGRASAVAVISRLESDLTVPS